MPSVEDVVVCASAVMPEQDSDLDIGGAIDVTTRVVFNELSQLTAVEWFSSDPSDNQMTDIFGRTATGVVALEAGALDGTNVVSGSLVLSRFLRAHIAPGHVGTVTLREAGGGPVIGLFPPGVRHLRRIFYAALAESPLGSSKAAYEKIFILNKAVDDFESAEIQQLLDPTGEIAFDLESVLDGTDSTGPGNNRYTSPSGYSFTTAAKPTATGDLPGGSAQGIWLQYQMPAGGPPAQFQYRLGMLVTSVPPVPDLAYWEEGYTEPGYVENTP